MTVSLTSILGTDLISTSRTTINNNYDSLNTGKADLTSPSLIGVPNAITGAYQNGSKMVATNEFVQQAISSVASINFNTTSVFSGSAPTSWADLDLSPVIGTVQKVVILKLQNNGANCGVGFRRNGDSGDYSYAASNYGPNVVAVANNQAVYVVGVTDSTGVVEWQSTGNASIIATMESYW